MEFQDHVRGPPHFICFTFLPLCLKGSWSTLCNWPVECKCSALITTHCRMRQNDATVYVVCLSLSISCVEENSLYIRWPPFAILANRTSFTPYLPENIRTKKIKLRLENTSNFGQALPFACIVSCDKLTYQKRKYSLNHLGNICHEKMIQTDGVR